jgi:uncharacterized protein
MRPLAPLLAVAALAVLPAAASAQTLPEGATWKPTYITTADGERLHADVMRPEGATDADKTPVILVVSPYLGDTHGRGPVPRFFDLYEGADVFDAGYSVVQVSTRGTGGSTGCLDILGPGEQEDVRAAVEWAAKAPWSNGKVGMYGKSYDANLGLAGAATEPAGLAAVVAQQVGVDRYRGSYNGRVRLAQSLLYPSATYGLSAEGSPGQGRDQEYTINRTSRSADCQAPLAPHYLDDPSSPFWQSRNFDDLADGSEVPVLITGGYLDNATNIGGGTVEYFNNIDGPKRLWIGWWDHVRGNDRVGGEEGPLAMGREGWFDEVRRWFDHFLMGKGSVDRDPAVVAQTSDGSWYETESFPPPSARDTPFALKGGTYADDASNNGSADTGLGAGGLVDGTKRGNGVWTIGPALQQRTQIAGVPRAEVRLGGVVVPRTNVVVNLYDVSPDGKATFVSRGATLADAAGRTTLPLWPTDWVFERGHRIGVLVSGSNMDNYVHVPTGQTVTVTGGQVVLPQIRGQAGRPTQGTSNPRLESFRQRAPFPVPASALAAAAS